VPIGEKVDIAYSIATADLNNDGHLDIVLGNRETPGLILLNGGKGVNFAPIRFGDSQGAAYGLAIGDVNGDGLADIAVARSGAPSMLYLNSF